MKPSHSAGIPSHQVEIIGTIRSCFKEKFGIPRQPGMITAATASLEIFPPFNRKEMVRGLETFSHIWLHFVFHESIAEGWRPTVRPPWLGGRQRVGVFACRSPHRPNHLGLSVVRLEAVRFVDHSAILDLSGIDLLDGTPVIDIKPYLPYSDSLISATGGYATAETPAMTVELEPQCRSFCQQYEQRTGRRLERLIRELIGLDPRPAGQKSRDKEIFGMRLWDVNIRWRVTPGGCTVVHIETCQEEKEW
ncbi:tRNA (N6-threonylcarbamoyladenosine(37)-N6)-methyltransferase TrmO [Desulfobulbus alkaliphilus]|uniref:tRNA (N6-threonylcarbamoyladenosine(37)-N6)-methyltransferase TrmO n=1 Tax=Desulfobulbus alkaliphilus TaxID=869814 RepID=UPI001964A4E1|nr:tRNA (N6-threonylcarbamoyladenosine(37)-N6)-methyltransferase TrmO [Desulfobulbus alkaliphilus]MBM9538490.1 tRNA (N6-threonylcarbamoyladenosine(37)-N6)-methyltransferase TrmO [Desulfobulbus alkaliphilus]